jgi:hypothetical protein
VKDYIVTVRREWTVKVTSGQGVEGAVQMAFETIAEGQHEYIVSDETTTEVKETP